MMKRVIALVCVLVLAVSVLTACNPIKNVVNGNEAGAPVASVADGNVASAADAASSAPEAVSSAAASQAEVQIPASDITGTGTAANGITVEGLPSLGEYSNKLFLFLTNNSGADCNATINVDFFDANGGIIGTTSGYVDALQNGTTVVENFYCDDPFAKYEYSVATSDLSYYIPVDKDLTIETNKATNKIIVSITNNGTQVAKYPEYTAFFYKGGQLVYDNWGYCDDADSEIKPGNTERDECSCYEEFDDVKVFVHSYAYKDD